MKNFTFNKLAQLIILTACTSSVFASGAIDAQLTTALPGTTDAGSQSTAIYTITNISGSGLPTDTLKADFAAQNPDASTVTLSNSNNCPQILTDGQSCTFTLNVNAQQDAAAAMLVVNPTFSINDETIPATETQTEIQAAPTPPPPPPKPTPTPTPVKPVFPATPTHLITWQGGVDGLNGGDIKNLIKADDGLYFAGTHGNGVYMTTDAGATWHAINTNLGNLDINRLVFDKDNQMLYAATNNGVYASAISGNASWTLLGTNLNDENLQDIVVAADQHRLYVASQGHKDSDGNISHIGVYAYNLNNPGSNWTLLDNVDAKGNHLLIRPGKSLAVGDNYLYANFEHSSPAYSFIFRRPLDGSGNWDTFYKHNWMNYKVQTTRLIAFYDHHLYAATTAMAELFKEGLFSIDPNAKHPEWHVYGKGLDHTIVALQFANDKIYAAVNFANNNIYQIPLQRAFDSWTSLEDPSYHMQMIKSFLVDSENVFMGFAKNGILKSNINGPLNWQQSDNGVHNVELVNTVVHGNTLFTASKKDGVYRSDDNGKTWIADDNNLPNKHVTQLYVVQDSLFAGTSRGLYRLDLNAANGAWVVVLPGFKVNAITGHDNVLYINDNGPGVFGSTDLGKSWSNLGKILSQDKIVMLGKNLYAFDPKKPASIEYYDFNARKWVAQTQGLDTQTITAMSYDAVHNRLFAGTNGEGVYSLDLNNTSATWQAFNTDLSAQTAVTGLTVFNGVLYASTQDVYASSKQKYYINHSAGIISTLLDGSANPAWISENNNDTLNVSFNAIDVTPSMLIATGRDGAGVFVRQG